MDTFFDTLLSSACKYPRKNIRYFLCPYLRFYSGYSAHSFIHQSLSSFGAKETGVKRSWDHLCDEKKESLGRAKHGGGKCHSVGTILFDSITGVCCTASQAFLRNLWTNADFQEVRDHFLSVMLA